MADIVSGLEGGGEGGGGREEWELVGLALKAGWWDQNSMNKPISCSILGFISALVLTKDMYFITGIINYSGMTSPSTRLCRNPPRWETLATGYIGIKIYKLSSN